MSLVSFMLTERQQRILRVLLMHPDCQYSFSDLVRLAGRGNGATQRVMERLEVSCLVLKSARGNQRRYSINRAHPIHMELRSICIKTFGLADLVSEELEPLKPQISEAFLFGPVARGSDRPDSDVDLMIIGEVDIFDLGSCVSLLETRTARTINLNLYTTQEWIDLRNHSVIRSISNGPRIEILSNQAV